MSDNNSYFDLAQRLTDAFPEIESDIRWTFEITMRNTLLYIRRLPH